MYIFIVEIVYCFYKITHIKQGSHTLSFQIFTCQYSNMSIIKTSAGMVALFLARRWLRQHDRNYLIIILTSVESLFQALPERFKVTT